MTRFIQNKEILRIFNIKSKKNLELKGGSILTQVLFKFMNTNLYFTGFLQFPLLS